MFGTYLREATFRGKEAGIRDFHLFVIKRILIVSLNTCLTQG